MAITFDGPFNPEDIKNGGFGEKPPLKDVEKYDIVQHPSHYNEGRRFEVIDVMEDWVRECPTPAIAGSLYTCLKYLGRLFKKNNALEDAKKARWYLDRLISQLEEMK